MTYDAMNCEDMAPGRPPNSRFCDAIKCISKLPGGRRSPNHSIGNGILAISETKDMVT